MTVFYRGPCARITHQVFETYCPARRTFAVGGLRAVHVVHVGHRPTGALGVRLHAIGAAGATLIISWPTMGTLLGSMATLAVLAAASVSSGGCWRTRRLSYELHGWYRGSTQRLFATSDPVMFGQVRRALIRALEYRADTI